MLDRDQWGIIRGSALALAVAGAVIGGGFLSLPPALFGLSSEMSIADQIAFALKWDLPVLVWLVACVRAVSKVRFRSVEDRAGSAFGRPSLALAIRAAVLQNSLEQTILAVGADSILATLLRGVELVLLPLLVLLYLVGRVSFAIRYASGAPGRAFGMALTAAPTAASYGVDVGLMIAGR